MSLLPEVTQQSAESILEPRDFNSAQQSLSQLRALSPLQNSLNRHPAAPRANETGMGIVREKTDRRAGDNRPSLPTWKSLEIMLFCTFIYGP